MGPSADSQAPPRPRSKQPAVFVAAPASLPLDCSPDETLLRVLGKGSSVAIFRADLQGNLLYVNERFCELWRQPISELLGQGWTRRIHPGDRHIVQEWTNPREAISYYRLVFPDGDVAYLYGQQSILHEKSGSPIGKVGTILDVTEREQARRFDAKRAQLLEAVAHNDPTRVPLRLVSDALEEQFPKSCCIVLHKKDDTVCLTVGHRTPRELAELVQRELEDHAATLRSPEIAGEQLWPTLYRDVLAAQDQLRRLVGRAGMRYGQWSSTLSAGGDLVGSIHLVHKASGGGLHLDPREGQLLKECSRLASVAHENRQLYQLLVHRANHDPVTELPNRSLLRERLEQFAGGARPGRGATLLYVDVDRFKQVNDLLGHTSADTLLRLIAGRLSSYLNEEAVLARIGGDEFGVLLPGVNTIPEAAAAAERLLGAMEEPFIFEGHQLSTTLSIGVAMYPEDGGMLETLLMSAYKAMFRAKTGGRNNYQVFQKRSETGVCTLAMEALLRRALEHELFEIHYQPQCSPHGEIKGFEALLRLRDQEKLWAPDQFIGIAEESGLIVRIGEMVLRKACLQSAAWQRRGSAPVRIAVNVSALQFAQRDFPDRVLAILAETRLAPELLELELTESLVMTQVEESAAHMRRLAAEGIRLAIDDFGTGYSSLSYLHQLPVHTLKIDKSFVRHMLSPGGTCRVVAGILSLAKSLSLSTVAEGVENEEQRQALLAQSVDLMQGYLYSEPVSAVAAESLLACDMPLLRPETDAPCPVGCLGPAAIGGAAAALPGGNRF